jgi:RNA polymerase sigma-70 factor (ECF subfamily)
MPKRGEAAAFRRVGLDEGAADDAAQETFVLAARKLETIELGRERSFLFGTALLIAANVRRSRDYHSGEVPPEK